MKDFAKSIVCNTKAGNSNKAEIIEKKKKEGATLKVDNGQKLEFSDGSTYVKTSFSDDYREAHNYTGNKKLYWDVGNYDWDVGIFNGQWYITKNGQKFKGPFRSMNEAERYLEGHKWEFEGKLAKSKTGNTRTGNSYNWEERRGHQELYDPTFPFGGHVRGYVEKTKNGYVGAKTNGSILIAKKEFATEAEAKKFVENKQTGNTKVGNAAKTFSGKYLDIYDNGTVVVKEGWAFGEKASVNTFERWLDYNIQAKEKVLKETKAMKEEFKKNFI